MRSEIAGPAAVLSSFVEASRRPPLHPYRSLEPFRFADASLLAARDREVEQLVRLITMYRGVLLYGESGSGKTSVINAGLLPRMIEEGYWPHRVRIQPPPGTGLELERIASADEGAERFLPSAFPGATSDGRQAIAASEFVAAVTDAADRTPLLLVFDQFEELVTLFPKSAELSPSQSAIIDAILTLLRGGAEAELDDHQPMVPVKLLFAFREDYLASLKPLLERHPDLIHQGLRLIPPAFSCATEIIRAPFVQFPDHYRPEITPALAGQIATSLKAHREGDELALSELQIVCSRLWQASDPDALLLKRGIAGLLEDHTEAALQALDSRLRDAAIAILSQLVTAGNTRNVISRDDLIQRAHDEQDELDPALLSTAMERLESGSGLIKREKRHDLDLFELTSEFLIPWIVRKREAQQLRREQARRLRRVRLGSAAIFVFLVVAVGLALVFVHEAQNAQTAAAKARTAAARARDREIAATAQALLHVRPDVSLGLALAAYRANRGSAPVRAVMAAAYDQVWRSNVRVIFHGFRDTAEDVALGAHNTLAAASADGTVRLWDTASERLVGQIWNGTRHVKRHPGFFSIALSPQSGVLAAGGPGGKISFWSGRSGGRERRVGSITAGNSVVRSLAFSPDGRWLSGADISGRLELWRMVRGRSATHPRVLRGSGLIKSVAFSPDSRTLAAVGANGRIERWSVATARRLRWSGQVDAHLDAVAFNPHGRGQIAVAGDGGTVYLWEPGHKLQKLRGTGLIRGLAFSPNGKLLAAANINGSVQLWRVSTRTTRDGLPLTGPDGVLTSVAYSQSGDALAATSSDGTVWVWPQPLIQPFHRVLAAGRNERYGVVAIDGGGPLAAAGLSGIRLWRPGPSGGVPTGRGTVLSPGGHFTALAFGPKGELLSGRHNGEVQEWRTGGRQPKLIRTLVGGGPPALAVALSPTGRTWAYARGPTVVVRDPNHLLKPPHAGSVDAITFSADGTRLATADKNGAIVIWSVSDGKPIRTLTNFGESIFTLAFRPVRGSPLLASGGGDATARVWNVNRNRERAPLNEFREFVRSVAFDATGTILAVGAGDGTIRLWAVNGRHDVGIAEPLSDGGKPILSVAVGPNGRYLAAANGAGAVMTWLIKRLPGRRYIGRIVCHLIGTGPSASEYDMLLPRLGGYKNPCPVTPR